MQTPPPHSLPETPRPLVHFTPPADWLNDPNGLVYYNDRWHLFYQFQPAQSRGKHWGHAVSRDLLHWEHLPVALYPDEMGEIWSGSCVVDGRNSSGFFDDGGQGLVAIFTHRKMTEGRETQAQSLAYSRDDGLTWTKYAHNPVLTCDSRDFRDPKVFWHDGTNSWVMVVAVGERAEIYRSPDLKTWQKASSFGEGRTEGLVWECPDLFFLPDAKNGGEVWILLGSFIRKGGHYSAYFAGAFDGWTFTPRAEELQTGRRISFGPDDYAPVTFSDAPNGRRVLMGWLNHWSYASDMGTNPWTGQMTLPRELKWENEALVQSLPPECEAARFWPQLTLEAGQSVTVDAPLWELLVPPSAPPSGSFWLEARQNNTLIFTLTRSAENGAWVMQRSAESLPPVPEKKAGRDAFFLAPCQAPLAANAAPGEAAARLIVDTCSVEAFCEGGQTLFCFQVFPPTGGTDPWQISLLALDE